MTTVCVDLLLCCALAVSRLGWESGAAGHLSMFIAFDFLDFRYVSVGL